MRSNCSECEALRRTMFSYQVLWKRNCGADKEVKMVKELKYRGKSLEELQQMGYAELAEILPARARRSLKRGLTDPQKKLIEEIKTAKPGKPVRTHCRDMIILPEMVDKMFNVYSGQKFGTVSVTIEMIGHYLGEFIQTRKEVAHKAPGIGATRGTKHVSVK